jgi:hypothetical protein
MLLKLLDAYNSHSGVKILLPPFSLENFGLWVPISLILQPLESVDSHHQTDGGSGLCSLNSFGSVVSMLEFEFYSKYWLCDLWQVTLLP